ncbi:ATP-binding cassette domain-containing protein [Streptomyces sp. cg36]|uniref:ATP-binding cassette domain-containing protein n=1 Tax=Streptomyces sp. cg36 TaxID=3238798 RepID=UPI0034E22127
MTDRAVNDNRSADDHRAATHHRATDNGPADHRAANSRPTATGTTDLAIAAHGLRKSYGDNTVLDGVDIAVPPGTIFSLLGPNGAGKTTAVKILSTLIAPDPTSGSVRVGGHDLATGPQAVRAAIGVTGQFSAVDGLITGTENMLLMADLHHLSRREGRRVAAELLERFDLTEAAKKPASTYSGGMKRRLDIAMTLVGGPRIIFLDEPTTGLDPRSRHQMWQIIRELVRDGVTVFLTTQYLEEADELADRIAVLNDGRIAAEGTADELKRLVPGGHVRLRFADPEAYWNAAAALAGTAARETSSPSPDPAHPSIASSPASRDDESLTLRLPSDGSQRDLRGVLDRLDAAGVEADELTVHTPDLDDVFFALTGGAGDTRTAPRTASPNQPTEAAR